MSSVLYKRFCYLLTGTSVKSLLPPTGRVVSGSHVSGKPVSSKFIPRWTRTLWRVVRDGLSWHVIPKTRGGDRRDFTPRPPGLYQIRHYRLGHPSCPPSKTTTDVSETVVNPSVPNPIHTVSVSTY